MKTFIKRKFCCAKNLIKNADMNVSSRKHSEESDWFQGYYEEFQKHIKKCLNISGL